MLKRYVENLIHLCSEEQFGQDAVEWAILSGHVQLTYQQDTDLQHIMAIVDEPAGEKPVRRYDQIIEAYRKVCEPAGGSGPTTTGGRMMVMNIPTTTPFYPLRPVNGGPLDRALPKSCDWHYEPKVNGWRTLVHVPTGTMFNRKGERLSIEKEFSVALCRLGVGDEFEWLDCEALDRRHKFGRGSLIVLDWPVAGLTYLQRREALEAECFMPHSVAKPLAEDMVQAGTVTTTPG